MTLFLLSQGIGPGLDMIARSGLTVAGQKTINSLMWTGTKCSPKPIRVPFGESELGTRRKLQAGVGHVC